MRTLAALARGTGRIGKILLLLVLLAVLGVAIPGGLAKAVQHLAEPHAPDHLPTPTGPDYATADELLLAVASAGAGCDGIEAFPTTTAPAVVEVPVTEVGDGATTDEEAAVAVAPPAAPVVPGVAGSSSGITCTTGEARAWLLVYADAAARDEAMTGSLAANLCPLAEGQVALDAGAAGNWVYVVAGDGDVLDRATDALDLELTPDVLDCPTA